MITAQVTVTRPELALADLPLHGAEIWVVDFDPGDTTWRRFTASSSFVHGEVLVHAVRAQLAGSAKLEVTGATEAALEANLDAVRAAFSQLDYQIYRNYGGVTVDRWAAQPADYKVGASYPRRDQRVVPVTLNVPLYPVQIA